MSSGGKASVRPLERPLDTPGDEAIVGTRSEDAPVEEKNLLERRLEAQHLRRALHQVRCHHGVPMPRRHYRDAPHRAWCNRPVPELTGGDAEDHVGCARLEGQQTLHVTDRDVRAGGFT